MSQHFIEEDKNKTSISFRELLSRLWPYVRAEKSLFIQICILVILFASTGRAIAFLFGYTVDHVIADKNITHLFVFASIFFFFQLSRSFLSFLSVYKMEMLGNRVMFVMRDRLIGHVQNLPLTYFDRNPIGRIVTRVTHDVLSLGDLFNQGLAAIFINLLELATIVVSMLVISPRMTLVSMFVSPIAVWIALKISSALRVHFGETKKAMAALISFTSESLGGARVLHLFMRTKERYERFQSMSAAYLKAQLKTVRQFALLWPVLSFFNLTTICSSLFFGALWADSTGLSVGQLSSFILLVQGFYGPIRAMIERYNQFQNSLAGADRIFTLLEEKTEASEGMEFPPGRLRGEIEFRDVSFRYSEKNPYALKNINLKLRPGESVALVGRTGSGKTTCTSLLQKFYPITEGEIFIDGLSLSRLIPRQVRERLGMIQQDNFIFRATIRDNVTLGRRDISDEKVIEALKAAGAYDLTMKMGGLDSELQERGQNLSVGERQLIAFARIFAHDPDVLILDEATANIDSKNEAIIHQSTLNLIRGRTAIIIAHRLSTVVHCDRIVVLKDGQIIEQGSHASLLAARGAYFELYQQLGQQH